jgi:hypothetical protein
MKCEICGSDLRADNTVGVDRKTAECNRERCKRNRHAKADRDAAMTTAVAGVIAWALVYGDEN